MAYDMKSFASALLKQRAKKAKAKKTKSGSTKGKAKPVGGGSL